MVNIFLGPQQQFLGVGIARRVGDREDALEADALVSNAAHVPHLCRRAEVADRAHVGGAEPLRVAQRASLVVLPAPLVVERRKRYGYGVYAGCRTCSLFRTTRPASATSSARLGDAPAAYRLSSAFCTSSWTKCCDEA